MNTTPSRQVPFAILKAGFLVLAGSLVIAFLNPDQIERKSHFFSSLAIGAIWGTIWGQTSLAGAWMAYSTIRESHRLMISLAWLGILWAGILTNLFLSEQNKDELIGLIAGLGAFLLGVWLFNSLVFWGLGWGLRWRLRRQTDLSAHGNQGQFGLLHLFAFMSIFALLLGLIRIAFSQSDDSPDLKALGQVCLLFGVQVLLANLSVLGILGGLTTVQIGTALVIGVSTLLMALVLSIDDQWESGPLVRNLTITGTCVQTFWIAVFGLVVRGHGYRLART